MTQDTEADEQIPSGGEGGGGGVACSTKCADSLGSMTRNL